MRYYSGEMSERLLNTKEACEHYGVDRRTLGLWAQEKGFPPRRWKALNTGGAGFYYSVEAVNRFLKKTNRMTEDGKMNPRPGPKPKS